MTQAYRLNSRTMLRARHITEPAILTVSQLRHQRGDPLSPANHVTETGHPVPRFSRTVHVRPEEPDRSLAFDEMLQKTRAYPPREPAPDISLMECPTIKFDITEWPRIPNWTESLFRHGQVQIEATLRPQAGFNFECHANLITPENSEAAQTFERLGGQLGATPATNATMDEHAVNDLLSTWRNPLDHHEGETLGIDQQSGQIARWSRYSETTMNGHIAAHLEEPDHHVEDFIRLTIIRAVLTGMPTMVIDSDGRYRKLTEALGGMTVIVPGQHAGIWPKEGHTYDVSPPDAHMIGANRQLALMSATGIPANQQQLLNLTHANQRQEALNSLAGSQWQPMFGDDTILNRMQAPMLTRADVQHLSETEQTTATALLTSAVWEAAIAKTLRRLLVIDRITPLEGYDQSRPTPEADLLLSAYKRARRYGLAIAPVFRHHPKTEHVRGAILQNTATRVRPTMNGVHLTIDAGNLSAHIILTATPEEWAILKDSR